jgi:hypothetical protein
MALHRIKQIKCLLNINNYKKLDILQAKKTLLLEN